MRAAWYERTGPAAEVLEVGELPDPTPGAGEVLVRLEASGVNPADVKKRAGWGGLEMTHPRVVPHADGAGTIEAVGPGVPASRIGERVWTWNAQGGNRWRGTAAGRVALPSRQAPRLPEGVDAAVGASLGVPACTAHFAVHAGGAVAGRTVLVQGGAGAVGHLAVQWAKWAGATVVATVSSEEKARIAREAGADHVLDYTEGGVAERIRSATDGKGVDRIVEVDFAANLDVDVEVIRDNGTIATYSSTSDPAPTLPYYPLAFRGVTLRLVQAYLMPAADRRRAVRAVRASLTEGRLDVRVAATYPIEEIVAAHEAVEAGRAIGNVVVTIR